MRVLRFALIGMIFPLFFTLPALADEGTTTLFKNIFSAIAQNKIDLKKIDLKLNRYLIDQGASPQMLKESQWSLSKEIRQPQLQTIQSQYLYKGVPVLGGKGFIHLTAKGIEKISSDIPLLNLDTTPTFEKEVALKIAQGYAAPNSTGSVELNIFPEKGNQGRLIYQVRFSKSSRSFGSTVILDAHSGALIAHIPNEKTLASSIVLSAKDRGYILSPQYEKKIMNKYFKTYSKEVLKECEIKNIKDGKEQTMDAQKCYQLMEGKGELAEGTCQLVNTEGQPTDFFYTQCELVSIDGEMEQETTSSSGMRATENVKKALQYYQDRFNRNGFDGEGTRILSIVQAGYQFANAAWIGGGNNLMLYGGGDEDFEDFTLLTDIAGHEMTHGVVEHTANLLGMDESGALNEGISDFFGKMISGDGKWLIGQGIFRKDSDRGIRNLANPQELTLRYVNQRGEIKKAPYPQRVDQKIPSYGACTESNDVCNVHNNSTIPSHALYLMHENPEIGQEKTEEILYTALTHFLTETSDFVVFSNAMKKACQSLDYSEKVCQNVSETLDQVGL